ncbi:MAG: alpha/beta hydrolase, partial [Caldilinea sp. CFX5]|nr:alpha/beta hydrolase [Caldilinea sp. CFX5]
MQYKSQRINHWRQAASGLLLMATVFLAACQPIQAEGSPAMPNSTQPVKTGYAAVNGLQMYYEIHGTAAAGQPPLVLLHGAFSAIGTSFGAILPYLAESRQVVAFELQAHGRTADIDRPMSMEAMADDVAAAVQQLGFDQV